MTKDEPLDQALFVRVAQSDLDRLDELVARIALATRTGLAREALRLGLAQIEEDPGVLFGRKLDMRGGARKRGGRRARKRA